MRYKLRLYEKRKKAIKNSVFRDKKGSQALGKSRSCEGIDLICLSLPQNGITSGTASHTAIDMISLNKTIE